MKPSHAAWVFAACVSLCAQAQQTPEKVGPPAAMAALGDSITQAFGADPTRFNQPDNSWSTGNDGGVVSHYTQLAELGEAPVTFNLSVSGAKMGGLATQANSAVARRTADGGTVDYVTLLMGGNDVCSAASEATMTSTADFRSQFAAAMEALTGGLPDARIFVASIPDVYVLWEALHTDAQAVSVWNRLGTCQAMLANPQSEDAADVERRARVRQHVEALNQQLAEVCDDYLHCRYDQGAVFNIAFTAAEVSTLDYFHPSLAGQSTLGAVTWPATYDFTDLVAPATTAEIVEAGSEDVVTLTAVDDVGVRGIEYRLPGDLRWSRYDAPVSVPDGDTLAFRAVDLNGNLEASQQYRRGGLLPETDAGAPTDAGQVAWPDAGAGPGDDLQGGCSCNTGGLLPTAAFALLVLLRRKRGQATF